MVGCYFAKFRIGDNITAVKEEVVDEEEAEGYDWEQGEEESDEREVTMFWKFVAIRMFISLIYLGKWRCEIK